MKDVQVIDSANLNFTLRSDENDSHGKAYVARAFGADVSENMGIGFARWEGASVAWKVLYDEVIFVLDGCFELTANGKTHKVSKGQVMFIPKDTDIVYGGHAFFGYVVYPGNWKQLHGLT